MIGLLFLVTLAQAAPANAEPVMISFVTLHAKDADEAELALANRYASCISLPYFPMPDEFAAKHQKCRALPHVNKANEKLARLLDQLDSAVRRYPGSEATLGVKKN